jgi:hypothetical protein
MTSLETSQTQNHICELAGLEGIEYSYCVFTQNSENMNTLFGFNYDEIIYHYMNNIQSLRKEEIDEPEIFLYAREIIAVQQSPIRGLSGEISIPTPERVRNNFIKARCLLAASRETEQVIDYFFELAQKIGSFFALPYLEVIKANNGIYEHTIDRALEEGFVIKTITRQINGKDLEIIELSDKFKPL